MTKHISSWRYVFFVNKEKGEIKYEKIIKNTNKNHRNYYPISYNNFIVADYIATRRPNTLAFLDCSLAINSHWHRICYSHIDLYRWNDL